MSGEQIKPGYKRTEVGIIPADWTAKRLREISPSQSVGLVINPSTYFDPHGTVPMLVGSNVHENSIDWTGAKRISLVSHRKLPASAIYENDLVTVRVGDPGVTAVVPKEFNDSNCASMMIVRGHSSFDSTWLCHLMNSHLGRSQVESIQYGTAQKQFNISDAINFQYPTPSLSEQRAIAAVLSDVDALLAKLDHLIAKKRDLKQATMQQLLTGQTRLPGFSGKWEVKRLGDLLRVRHGKDQKAVVLADGKYPILATGGEIGRTNTALHNKPSVLIGRKGTIDSPMHMDTPFWTVDTLFYTEINSRTNTKFLYYQFLLIDWYAYNEASGVPSLNSSTIENIEIQVPDLSEQTTIATVLSDMDTELAALESRRNKTRELKQGMMQELLTGKIRLGHRQNCEGMAS